jgi:hypothetical protein
VLGAQAKVVKFCLAGRYLEYGLKYGKEICDDSATEEESGKGGQGVGSSPLCQGLADIVHAWSAIAYRKRCTNYRGRRQGFEGSCPRFSRHQYRHDK